MRVAYTFSHVIVADRSSRGRLLAGSVGAALALLLGAGCLAAAPPPSPWQHEWSRGAVFYEVFVRSFQDSDGDGIGDLRGLVDRLDYLNDGKGADGASLGVDALWLMPIFRSPSDHGYDTSDYEEVQPAYGTRDDLRRLLDQAHRRGMRVILDLVLNHTSSQHPWFVEASGSLGPHHDWYVWRGDDPGWTQPWGGPSPTWHRGGSLPFASYYYGVFWSGMPDLNWRNPEVRAEMRRVAKLWLDAGVDGFRLDAARHLVENGGGDLQVDQPETHAAWREFAAWVRQVKPTAVLVGETWTDTPRIAAYYGDGTALAGGDELPMNFDFPLADAILAGVRAGAADGIAAKLREVAQLYPSGAIDAPFLTNHDMVRVSTQLGGDRARLALAASLLLTVPGAPFAYYGEELGLANGAQSNDEAKRTPMPWDASPGAGFSSGQPWHGLAPGHEATNVAVESADPHSLLNVYRRLIAARHRSAALRQGDVQIVSGAGSVLAFRRSALGETVLVVHNLADRASTAGPFAVRGKPAVLYASPGVGNLRSARGGRMVTMPAGSTGIWRLR